LAKVRLCLHLLVYFMFCSSTYLANNVDHVSYTASSEEFHKHALGAHATDVVEACKHIIIVHDRVWYDRGGGVTGCSVVH